MEYDSWLDCFEIKELKVRKIVVRKAEKKGRLNTYDLCIMMLKLKDSEFIDEHLKKVHGINSFENLPNCTENRIFLKRLGLSSVEAASTEFL